MNESRFKFDFGDKVTFNDKNQVYVSCTAIVVGREWYPNYKEPQYNIVIRDKYTLPNYPDHFSSIQPLRLVSESELTAD